MDIKKFIKENADDKNAEFERKLIATKYHIFGIKTPILEAFAKKLAKEGKKFVDFDIASHEEVILAGLTIAHLKINAKEKLNEFSKILPFIDNWGSCDCIVPRLKGLESEKEFFASLLESDKEFYVRVGIIYLKKFFLNDNLKEIVELLNEKVKLSSYYVEMALAWTFQHAFTKDFEYMLNFMKNVESKFVKRMTYRKVLDSLVPSREQKAIIKELLKSM